MRQGFCHACLDQNRDAVRAFGEGLRRAENDGDKFAILSQIVDLGLNLSGNGPPFCFYLLLLCSYLTYPLAKDLNRETCR